MKMIMNISLAHSHYVFKYLIFAFRQFWGVILISCRGWCYYYVENTWSSVNIEVLIWFKEPHPVCSRQNTYQNLREVLFSFCLEPIILVKFENSKCVCVWNNFVPVWVCIYNWAFRYLYNRNVSQFPSDLIFILINRCDLFYFLWQF